MSTASRRWIVVLAIMLCHVAGCSPEKKMNALMEQVKQPEVQEYMNTWIKQNVVDDASWKQSAKFSYARGLGAYHLVLPKFDWSVLGVESQPGYFKLLGTPDAPEHIVFLGVGGRRAVIYSLSGKTPVDGQLVFSNEVTSVTSNLYLFDPHRED